MKNTKIIISIMIGAAIASTIILFSFKSPEPTPQEGLLWLQVTTVESVVPMGAGRSRMITLDSDGKMEEVKLKNFFSAVGINFSNIRQNDQQITDKIAQLTNEGWILHDITSGVYAGNQNGTNGIFITRYLFKKEE